MDTNLKSMWFLVLSCFLLAGCQTVSMPTGPALTGRPVLQNAPLIALSVADRRSEERIGAIGASQMFARNADTVQMSTNYLTSFLYDQGVNTVVLPQADLNKNEGIRAAIARVNGQGLARLEIIAIQVRSIDLLLDKPEYEVHAMLTVYALDGEKRFDTHLYGKEKSRALGARGQGKAIGRAFESAFWSLENHSGFQSALRSLAS